MHIWRAKGQTSVSYVIRAKLILLMIQSICLLSRWLSAGFQKYRQCFLLADEWADINVIKVRYCCWLRWHGHRLVIKCLMYVAHKNCKSFLETSSPNLIGQRTNFYWPQGKVDSFVYKVPGCYNEHYQRRTSLF